MIFDRFLETGLAKRDLLGDIGIHDISENGVSFTAKHEGFSSRPYNDIAMNATIGFGHLIHYGLVTNQDIDEWGTITKAQGLELLREDLKRYVTSLNIGLKVPQNQNQFDALTAFCYNIGQAGFLSSSCLKRINSRKPLEKIEPRWKVWNKIENPNGKLVVSQGLINRRAAEWILYTKTV